MGDYFGNLTKVGRSERAPATLEDVTVLSQDAQNL